MNFKQFINSDYLKNNPLCGIGEYKDTLDLATGVVTRRIKKYVIKGDLAFTAYGNGFYSAGIFTDAYTGDSVTVLASHYTGKTNVTLGQLTYEVSPYIGFRRTMTNLMIKDADNYTTEGELATWLINQDNNNTPLTIWYVLAEPTTETITVPSGLSGIVEGYLIQDGTPTPTNPIYPTANTVEKWLDINHYIMGTDTDTITTLPADIYANDTTATVGLKGNMEQSGTPTLTSPIQPQETGERTNNLIENYIANSSINETGVIESTVNYKMCYGAIVSGEKYTIDQNTTFAGFFENIPIIGSQTYNEVRQYLTSPTFTAPITGYIAYRRLMSSSNDMMNKGENLLPYEPYGNKIPIFSNSTTTPVYLGEVQSARRIKKLVFDGTENWSIVSGKLCISRPSNCRQYSAIVSTHFIQTQSANNPGEMYVGGSYINFNYDGVNDNVDVFKAYLATQYANGTPVTVWYILATETTGIVNAPLRKIGDYTDEVSGITIPTIAGANTISVGTTLQPSEVSVTYKGWHSVANTHVMAGLLADNPLCGISAYKDNLNLATGACTRHIQRVVLTGQENDWRVYTGKTSTFATSMARSRDNAGICSHYTSVIATEFDTNTGFYVRNSALLIISDTRFTDVSDFKTYLQQQYANGTPVTVWYILSTPTTETITVPSGLSGTEEGYLNQSGTPTPTNPIYPTANEVPMWN